MLKLEEELKARNLSRFHLIYGEERYMVRYYRDGILKQLAEPGDEMNCTFFQGEAAVPSAIADVGQILPFMAQHRLIVVQDSSLLKNASDMADMMEGFPDTTYVVFVERDVDKRNRLYKWIGENGCVTECARQSEPMLRKWVSGYMKRNGKSLSGECANFLLQRAGTDMVMLTHEMDKLIAYTGEREQVGREDIDAICSGLAESRVFDMIDAVARGERSAALKLYAGLLANKEPPMSILYLFARHINILLQIKECLSLGMSRGDMAKKIGIPPFTVGKYSSQAEMFTSGQLLDMLRYRADLEERIKTGRISDQLSVEMFLIQALTNR